ncbi:MAG: response regulator [Alphaproteobacteria bacterium]|jgi:signal transduction histidine kinase|nr:response regulator [Alphaproteobacteria bacterium]
MKDASDPLLASKILIVDDMDDNVEMLDMTLASEGYTNVTSTTDPTVVKDLHAKNKFDLILLDIRMPVMDGFQVMDQLRDSNRNDYLPILVLTAELDSETRIRALESGAKDFLSKPFERDEILNRIRNMLEVRHLYNERARKAETLEQMVGDRTRDLKQAMERAEAADRAKGEILANMSHELRTPLNAVIGFSEMVKNETFGPLGNDTYKEYASVIHDAGNHLLRLVSDILDVSSIETGNAQMNEEPVDVSSEILSCIKMVLGRAQDGEVELDAQLPDALAKLNADRIRLKQILINLLDNAIKFNRPGGHVTASADLDDQDRMVISVSDDGIGIAPDDVELVMTKFGQVESAFSRERGGTGLGLNLVQSYAGLHGATVDLNSTPDQGTTVTVTFPTERTVPA